MSRIAADPAHLGILAQRYSGGVYLHWDFWCGVPDAVQREFCERALAAAPFEVVREYRERDWRFAFYRLAGSRSRTAR